MRRTRYHRHSPTASFATLVSGFGCLTALGAVCIAVALLLWIAADPERFIAGMLCGIGGVFVVQRMTRKRKYQPMASTRAGTETRTELPSRPTASSIVQPELEDRKPADVREPVFWGKQRIGWMDIAGNFIPDRKPPLLAS